MARMAGVDLPRDKRGEVAITYIYGIGRPLGEADPRRRPRRPEQAGEGAGPTTRRPALREHHRARVQGRGRPPPRGVDEHQAADGHRLATAASGTAGACRCAASAPTPTPAPARGRAGASMIKKKPAAPARRPRRAQRAPKKVRSRVNGRRAAKQRSRTRSRQRPERAARSRSGKEVRTGIAHVQATFNNTIVTLTDKMGNVVSWASAGQRGLQGLAQEHALRRPDGGRERGPQGDGARAQAGRGVRARARAPAARRPSARCRPWAWRSPRSVT